MGYRKFRADHLFTGHQWLDSDHVLITNDQGVIEAIVPVTAAGDDVLVFTGILSPGFVNCHCHLELSHLKNVIPEKTGMIDFLLAVISQRNFSPEQIQRAIELAELEMLQQGIVAVGDICNTVDTLAVKRQGLLYYHNFIEVAGFVEAGAQQRFDTAKLIFEQFGALSAIPVESNSIVPHAPYSVSPKLFNMIAHFPGNHLLTMHNQESMAEQEFLQLGKGDFLRLYKALGVDISFYQPAGKSSLQTCLPYFLPNQRMILVHNVTTNEDDLQFTHHSLPIAIGITTYLCLCPNANLYIGNALPNIELLRKHKVQLVVGTDSLASNHQLSILEELKTIRQHFPHIEIAELLQWATLNGAEALEIDSMFGSFDVGKQPGVLVVGSNLESVKRLL